MTTRETLKLHQEATDCSDSTMLRIVCEWLDTHDPGIDIIELDRLVDFVQDNLERGPGDCGPNPEDVLPRYDPRFTEFDQQAMWEGAFDEASDLNTKEVAQLVLDSWDLTSCIAACTIINGSHECEALAEMLQRIDNQDDEAHINGEFLRIHDDEDNYPALLDFAKRMGLINETEDAITPLGREYMDGLI